jgi:AbrB family looped-hinge helix DNA binding protein
MAESLFMRTTIDRAGRLVIPSKIRREAGIERGAPVEVRCRDGVIEIAPEPLEVRLKRKGRWLIAAPTRKIPPLTAETVERTRRAIQRERERAVR